MNKKNQTGFIVRSAINPAMILCTTGEMHPEMFMGPGPGRRWSARVYKTQAGASRYRGGAQIIVEQIGGGK